MKVVLGMPFLSLSNADIKFVELGKLTGKSYTAAKVLTTTIRVKLIEKREFANLVLNGNSETFVMYVAALEVLIAMPIHSSRAP